MPLPVLIDNFLDFEFFWVSPERFQVGPLLCRVRSIRLEVCDAEHRVYPIGMRELDSISN
jgi:hypothetical protein